MRWGIYRDVVYTDLLGDIIAELRESVAYAEAKGLPTR